jgi:transcriptional regulator with XRE-family HTH domain
VRFLIGHDLRSARERARITQLDAAKQIGCTPAKLSYMESGRTQQSPAEVTTLLRYYGVADDEVDSTVALAARPDKGTWWAPFEHVLPDWFKIFVGLEGMATRQFEYADKLLPGLLQTPAYATAVLSDSLHIRAVDIAASVRMRMARQRLTDTDNPPQFGAVIEEAVLDRPVGGPQVMREQLQHLLTLMSRDNIALQVMPTHIAVHEGLPGPFVLLGFARTRGIVYVEHHTGALYLQDRAQIEVYDLAADRLRQKAYSSEETTAAIKDRIARYTDTPPH